MTIKDKPSLEVVNMLRNGEAEIGIVTPSADVTGFEPWRFVPASAARRYARDMKSRPPGDRRGIAGT